jgi:hypothetical protein
MLRMLHTACHIPVEPQFEVYDGQGLFVARGTSGSREPQRCMSTTAMSISSAIDNARTLAASAGSAM